MASQTTVYVWIVELARNLPEIVVTPGPTLRDAKTRVRVDLGPLNLVAVVEDDTPLSVIKRLLELGRCETQRVRASVEGDLQRGLEDLVNAHNRLINADMTAMIETAKTKKPEPDPVVLHTLDQIDRLARALRLLVHETTNLQTLAILAEGPITVLESLLCDLRNALVVSEETP